MNFFIFLSDLIEDPEKYDYKTNFRIYWKNYLISLEQKYIQSVFDIFIDGNNNANETTTTTKKLSNCKDDCGYGSSATIESISSSSSIGFTSKNWKPLDHIKRNSSKVTVETVNNDCASPIQSDPFNKITPMFTRHATYINSVDINPNNYLLENINPADSLSSVSSDERTVENSNKVIDLKVQNDLSLSSISSEESTNGSKDKLERTSKVISSREDAIDDLNSILMLQKPSTNLDHENISSTDSMSVIIEKPKNSQLEEDIKTNSTEHIYVESNNENDDSTYNSGTDDSDPLSSISCSSDDEEEAPPARKRRQDFDDFENHSSTKKAKVENKIKGILRKENSLQKTHSKRVTFECPGEDILITVNQYNEKIKQYFDLTDPELCYACQKIHDYNGEDASADLQEECSLIQSYVKLMIETCGYNFETLSLNDLNDVAHNYIEYMTGQVGGREINEQIPANGESEKVDEYPRLDKETKVHAIETFEEPEAKKQKEITSNEVNKSGESSGNSLLRKQNELISSTSDRMDLSKDNYEIEDMNIDTECGKNLVEDDDCIYVSTYPYIFTVELE